MQSCAQYNILGFCLSYTGIDMFDKEVDIDGEKIKMYIW